MLVKLPASAAASVRAKPGRDLERLPEILGWRALGCSLDETGDLLDGAGHDRLSALRTQRELVDPELAPCRPSAGGVQEETTVPAKACEGMTRRKPVTFEPDWSPKLAIGAALPFVAVAPRSRATVSRLRSVRAVIVGVVLQAALNGDRAASTHPGLPVGAEALTADACAVVELGVEAIHLHPRDRDGRESCDADVVDGTVTRVQDACRVPVGVSTGAWIEPDPRRRAELVSAWRAPSFASVNLSEPGALEVMGACERAGIGIEAGVWSVPDAELLAGSRFAGTLVRVLIELIDVTPERAADQAQAIHVALDQGEVNAPRLQHGEGSATWPMFREALARGVDVRIGLEDTLELPDGRAAGGNVDLARAAIEIIAQLNEMPRGRSNTSSWRSDRPGGLGSSATR